MKIEDLLPEQKSLRYVLIIGGIIILISLPLLIGAKSTNPPRAALDKYTELTDKYHKSVGATLEVCTKNDKKLFVATGSNGNAAEIYYYEPDGNLVGSYEQTDIFEGTQLPPQINLGEYDCTILQRPAKE